MSIYSLISYFGIDGVTSAQHKLGNFANKTTNDITSTITDSPIISAFLYFGSAVVMIFVCIMIIFFLFMMLKKR